ncbi:hypothetical protein Tco_0727126 [Tanacetum coccineum]|uniref:Uncharacterized protein n=1 Tax=Tanacetum coccineum TaxID=301880 RepID=A0ABQ4YJT1_9ASTR
MELEPEVKVPGLECNRSLLEGVPFVNHMVIEEPGYEIFFIDVFGDQAFQRWDDIHKFGVDSHGPRCKEIDNVDEVSTI